MKILKGLRGLYEKHHNVKISDEAIEAAVSLSSRYINDRFLPDKAIDLMDEAAAKLRLKGIKNADSLSELKEETIELEERIEDCLKAGDQT